MAFLDCNKSYHYHARKDIFTMKHQILQIKTMFTVFVFKLDKFGTQMDAIQNAFKGAGGNSSIVFKIQFFSLVKLLYIIFI